MAKAGSDNARPRPLSEGKGSRYGRFFSATGLERECSTRSGGNLAQEPGVGFGRVASSCPTASAAEVMAVLRRALLLLRRYGWRSTHWSRDSGDGLTTSDAIQRAGNAGVACYHAKRLLTLVAGVSFPDWEAGQYRSEREVLALLRHAVRVARGVAFAPPAGGWRISTGPRPVAAKSNNVVQLGGKRHA